MKRFIDRVTVYTATTKTKKGKEFAEYIKRFFRCALVDEPACNELYRSIRKTVDNLNKKYPLSIPYKIDSYSRYSFQIYIDNGNINSNTVALIDTVPVLNVLDDHHPYFEEGGQDE